MLIISIFFFFSSAHISYLAKQHTNLYVASGFFGKNEVKMNPGDDERRHIFPVSFIDSFRNFSSSSH